MAATMRYRVDTCGGSSLVAIRTIFSSDSRYLMCCCGHIVKVLSVASGECVHELRGHKDMITSIAINSQNQLQLFSSSLDNTIKQWDYSDGILLRTYDILQPVSCVFSPKSSNKLFAVLEDPDRDSRRNDHCLKSFYLPKTTSKVANIQDTSEVIRGIERDQKKIAFGVNCEYVVSVTNQQLTVKFFNQPNKKSFHHQSGTFSCVACHPTEYCIATGDSQGQLYLWRNFHGSPKNVSKHKNHWHALKLEDVCFSTEGSYIFSVGHECTVVQWQYQTNRKDFLPRLGAPILKVSCSRDGAHIATSHEDNAIHVISNRKIIQTFQGLTRTFLDQHMSASFPTGFLVDPRSKSVVMNGKPGHLQFYSMHKDKQLYHLDIVCQNYISPENLEKPLVHTEIENAAFDSNGDWLVTIERRDDGETSMEMKLKFWQWSGKKQSFVLNTCVELPHQDKVNALCMKPYNNKVDCTPMAVTASQDGKFKLWTLVDDSDIYRKNVCWNCQSVGFYHDQPADNAAFSSDGSLLAVAFTHAITLWDPTTNDLKTVLSQPVEKTNTIRYLHFGNAVSSQYLVSASDKYMTVWNLLTCTVHWTVALQLVTLVKDPLTEYFAAVTKNSEVFVFNPSEQNPKYNYQIDKACIKAAVFVPHDERNTDEDALPWQRNSQLYLMNIDQTILTLKSEEEFLENERQREMTARQLQENLPQTPFSIFLEKTEVKQSSKKTDVRLHGTPNTTAVKEMLNTPAHVLPPVSSLCNSFMKILLISRSHTDRIDKEDTSDEERESQHSDSDDSDMEVEETTAVSVSHSDKSRSTEDHASTIGISTTTAADAKTLSKISSENYSWLKVDLQ
ncbi:WD repeat-containing protein 75-like [Glandiceps talaboti]